MKLRGKKHKKELAATISQGRDLRKTGQTEEAQEFLEKGIEQFPDDPELRLLYATVLLTAQPDRVAAEATKAAELAPDDPATLVRAGHLLLSEDRDAARSCAARANELAKPDFVLMSGLVHLDGLLAALDGEDELAEEKLRSAIASEPANEGWARQLAVFLAEHGRLADAVEILDEALEHVEEKTRIEQMRARMKKEITDLN